MAKRPSRASPDRKARAATRSKRSKRALRRGRMNVLLRWCMLGVLGFVGFLYYHPLATYFDTRGTMNARSAEVQGLRAEKARLESRLEASATLAALAREARQMNLVRPGERLFIVKGIPEWRRAHRTVRDDG